MQRFKSTRKVHAAKINAISHNGVEGAILYFGDEQPYAVSQHYVMKHTPDLGGYFVLYEDGYQSYCPAEAFERDHQADDGTEVGLPVSGYRPQNPVAIDCVNAMKGREELILQQLDHMKADPEVDQRWLAIGRTQLEQAFMAINRSIFKPDRVTFRRE